jgi:hypothetical protein
MLASWNPINFPKRSMTQNNEEPLPGWRGSLVFGEKRESPSTNHLRPKCKFVLDASRSSEWCPKV